MKKKLFRRQERCGRSTPRATKSAFELRQHRRLGRHLRQILAGGAGRPGGCQDHRALRLYDPKFDSYQADYLADTRDVAAGGSTVIAHEIFAGAKEVPLLEALSRQLKNIPLFERAVDFGWFFFLTKPLHAFLDWIFRYVGNMGIAILLLTICVKAVMFPLANKSYASMSKMKVLQPKMAELKEQYGEDKARFQQEMMALYKKEKVNPAAGCLPILVQIPVFYALYKVLYVTIDMRQAPFFGWIHDLSMPDPTTVLNLFGLIPWDPHLYLHMPCRGYASSISSRSASGR
jgi:YidC/Oxa1 family membrane protein insertase